AVAAIFVVALVFRAARQLRVAREAAVVATVVVVVASVVVPLDARSDEVFTGRGAIWRVAIEMFEENPIAGAGFTAYGLDGHAFKTLGDLVAHAHSLLLTF